MCYLRFRLLLPSSPSQIWVLQTLKGTLCLQPYQCTPSTATTGCHREPRPCKNSEI